jgi:uncharacterized membrane protein
MDAIFILIRFAVYKSYGYSHHWAAGEIIISRGYEPRLVGAANEPPKREGLLSSERNVFLLYLVLVAGVVTQFVKLMACSRVPWTQTWGCFYFLSYVVVEIMYRLGKTAQNDTRTRLAKKDALVRSLKWIEFWELIFGFAAIILQLAILAAVDMKAIPPDPNLIRRWTFIFVRFCAHFAVCLVHLPFMALKIGTDEPLEEHHWGFLMMSIIVPHIISATTQKHRFSQLYFMVSVIISYFSWMLYFFRFTKEYVLFCEPEREGRLNLLNLLAFDFFCRMLFFSVFWYAVHYDPTGTFKPLWTNYLG